jgi:hypothetical protein
MGCDIHFNIEQQDAAGKWRSATPKDLYVGRNYALFSFLAGIRGDWDPPIPPRGIPEDASTKVKERWKQWDGDGHTPSYLTLSELLKMGEMISEIPVLLNLPDYKKYKQGEKNITYYLRNLNAVEISNEEMDRRINLLCFDDETEYMTQITDISMKMILTTFYSNVVRKMQEMSKDDNDKVRCVFWFDN